MTTLLEQVDELICPQETFVNGSDVGLSKPPVRLRFYEATLLGAIILVETFDAT